MTLFSRRLGERAVAHRHLILGLSLLLTAVAATGLLHSSFDTSLAALLTESDPYLEQVDELSQEFPAGLQISFAVVNPRGSVFEPQVLNLLQSLKQDYIQIPGASRLATLLDYRSPVTGRALFDRPWTDYDPLGLDQIQQQALSDELLRGTLVSDNARLTFATISLASATLSNAARLEIADASLGLLGQLREKHPGLEITVQSDVLFEQSSRDAMVRDLILLLPFVVLACVATICYCFRSFAFGFCILIQALTTVLVTVGLLGYIGMSFNSISVIAPLVVVIVAVSHCVHIISIFKQNLALGLTCSQAMEQSVDHNFNPILLASLTTAIGFLSLQLCSSPAIQEFGRIVALGVCIAMLFTFSLLPGLLIWITQRIPSAGSTADAELPRQLIVLVNRVRKKYDRKLFGGFTLLAIITALLLPLNETDFNRLDYIPAESVLSEYYSSVGAQLNRGPALIYGVDTAIRDGAIQPEFLRQLDAFAEWLRQQPEVESVASLVEVVKTIYQARGGQDPSWYRIPDDANAIAMDLVAYADIQVDDFPLDGFIDQDFATIRLFVNAVPMSNQEILALDQKLTDSFANFLPDARLIHGSGLLLFARMDELVTIELLKGFSVSLLLITLTLIIGLRSVYLGILSIVPNLLPATMVFGLWGLFVGQLDPFVMMLFSISIGLVVDDTVHLLSHYLSFRKQGMAIDDAMDRSMNLAGPALVVTTLVLSLGTTLLIYADTLYFQQSARLLVPIVLLALALDLLYLPAILKRFDGGRSLNRRPA